jgi:hypothetical protein
VFIVRSFLFIILARNASLTTDMVKRDNSMHHDNDHVNALSTAAHELAAALTSNGLPPNACA